MIHYQSKDTSKEMIYKLMRSDEVKKASDCVGLSGKVTDYVIYDSNDYIITAWAFEDGTMVATNSATLRQEAEMMIDAFGEIPEIKILSGTSKNGRKYVTIALK